MFTTRAFGLFVLAGSVLVVPSGWSQMAISLHSGLVNHVEGRAQMEGEAIKVSPGRIPMLKEGKALSTQDGRVELLLTPGVFFRMAPNSSVRMISSALSNTLVELESGSGLVEVAELGKEHRVMLKMGESQTELLRQGLYEFDVKDRRVRVFDGRATVSLMGESALLTKGREVVSMTPLVTSKFDTKDTGSLYAWSVERAQLIGRANVNAASTLKSNGYRMTSSAWAWDPYFGLMTFMPRAGYYRSFYGMYYYSPSAVWQYYRYYDPSYGGYSGGGGGGAANSAWSGAGSGLSRASSPSYSGPSMSSGGGMRASAPAASAPAASAPAASGRGR